MEELANFRSMCKTVVGLENNFHCFLKERSLSANDFQIWFKRSGQHIVAEGQHITIPAGHLGLIAEVHLGVVLSKDTSEITRSEVKDHIGGYVVALNLLIRSGSSEAANTLWPRDSTSLFRRDIWASSLKSTSESFLARTQAR
uniref:FAA_hydrolase domain-containing protein n=1 Tax=Steinernema glaseri TaxID=37863 RepID=A0A1I7YV18_9BILA